MTASEWVPLLGLPISLAIVAGLAAAPGLRRVLWLARVPVALTAVAALALTGPAQARFLLAGIENGWQVMGFLAALLLVGTGTWFWTRWSLNLAWQGREPGVEALRRTLWFGWTPRIAALLPVAAAAICLLAAARLFGDSLGWVPWVLGFGLAGVAGLLVALAWGRRRIIDRRRRLGVPEADRAGLLLADEDLPDPPGPRPATPGAWLDLAVACLPFRWPLLLPMLAGFLLAILAVQAGFAWPSQVAAWIGAAPTALLGLAVLLTLLAPTIGLVAIACGWPALLFLFILMVGAATGTVNSFVRTEAALPPRPSLDQAAERWLLACAARDGPLRAMVVANGGGASRAALWTAASLRALELHPDGPEMRPGRDLFAVTGTSGGALGAAAYIAALDAAGQRCGEDRDDRRARFDRLQAGLAQDFLAPAFAGLFLGDGVWRVFGPLSAVAGLLGWQPEDRTVRLERAWEAAFAGGGGSPMAGGVVARSFDAPDAAPRLPLLVTNGTHQEGGRIAFTAPVLMDGHVPDAIDVLDVLEADVAFSTAAGNSARFPYVTSPGLLRRRGATATEGRRDFGQIVDGGYYDNDGAVAARAAADALAAAYRRLSQPGGPLQGRALHLFVVQVLSEPRLPPERIPRCGATLGDRPPEPASPSPLDFLTSPFGALVAVRGERASAGTAELRRLQCVPPPAGMPGDPRVVRHYHVFSLGEDRDGVMPPLSWVLPPSVRARIAQDDFDGFPEAGNRAELRALRDAWRAAR